MGTLSPDSDKLPASWSNGGKFAGDTHPFHTKLLKVDPRSFPYDVDPADGDPLDLIRHSQSPRVFNLHANPPTKTYAKDLEAVFEAAELLRQAFAIPTETVYGLAANALSAEAALTIFAAKNRPADNPLIVHVSSLEMLRRVLPERHIGDGPKELSWQEGVSVGTKESVSKVQGQTDSTLSTTTVISTALDPIPPHYFPLFRHFWPGPLTVLLPRHPSLIPSTTASSLPTVAYRFPSHPVARALIDACDFPLAAPSANSSGRPSPTTAQHVMDDLNGKIPAVLDGGPCETGVESTVVDGWCTWPGVVLRAGGVGWEDVRSVEGWEQTRWFKHGKVGVGERTNDGTSTNTTQNLSAGDDGPDLKMEASGVDSSSSTAPAPAKSLLDPAYTLSMLDRPLTPGMKYRHYKPNAEVVAVRLQMQVYDLSESASRLDNATGSADNQIKMNGKSISLNSELYTRVMHGITLDITHRQRSSPQQTTYACLLTSTLPDGPVIELPELLFVPSLPRGANLRLYSLGPNDRSHARNLFAGLRWADEVGASVCYVQEGEEEGLGRAVKERLGKAAGRVIVV
ncbi:hypothetical protein HDU93_000732 [Gonapodya sp. JEL0774]|nr:hypothetical protein HDU93_000732 [Gonapodya sp. JEL0774]